MLILGGNLFNGTRSDRVQDSGIRIEGDRFTAVGKHSDFKVSADGEEVIDATGLYLMPGLIDMHAHLTFSFGTGSPRILMTKSAPEMTIRAVRTAAVWLARGITTARELGGALDIPMYIRDAIGNDEIPGPRLIVCGQPIVVTGGHAWWVCMEADGADGFRKAARLQLKAGADYVKVMASHEPVVMPGPEPVRAELSVAEMKAAFDEAHDWGRLACCHAMGSTPLGRVIEAGVDLIEHGHYLNDRLAEEMASRGIVLTPTLSGYDVQSMSRRVRVGPGWGVFPDMLVSGHQAGFAAALRAGVMMTVGTDAFGLYAEEVDLMRRFGMTAIDSLLACTSNAARALRMENEIGTVQAGRRADLVLLRGDPMADPYQLDEVELVIKGGQVYRPAALAYSDTFAPKPTMMEMAVRERAEGSS